MGAKPRQTVHLTGVIDIECANWDRVVCAAYYAPGLPEPKRAFRTVRELVDVLLEVGGYWWAWGGGHYDLIAVAQELRIRGLQCQINLAGSRLTSIVVGKLHLHDAYALIPFGLDYACALAGIPPVGDLGWRCQCGEGCGGYCRIPQRPNLAELAHLMDYCIRDCVAAYSVLDAVISHWLAEGMYVRGTIGGTAWATAQAWLGDPATGLVGLPNASWHSATWRRIRRGYHGGRHVVGRAWAAQGERYDMRAAYGHALRETAFPVGACVEVGTERATKAYLHDLPGTYRATVVVPECHLPPLPWRSSYGRRGYVHGQIRGTWTQIELAAAEARGVRIVEIHQASVFPAGTFKVFAPLIDYWEARRSSVGADTPWGRLYRELEVSLSGKLAQGPERVNVLLNPPIDSIVTCDGRSKRSYAAGCAINHCTGKCGAWKQLDHWGHLWGVPRYQMGASSHVHWGAYVTASNRIRHLEGMEAVGTSLVYGDTDSVVTTDGAPPNVGTETGQFHRVGSFGDWECLAPKLYRYVDGSTGEVICRVAGMSRISDREWIAMRAHDQDVIDDRGVLTLLEASKKPGSWFKQKSRRGKVVADTVWRGDRRLVTRDGVTYPASRTELEKRDAHRREEQEEG